MKKKITAIATAFSLCMILIFSIATHSAGSEIPADSQAIEIIPVSMPVVTYIPIEGISESNVEEVTKEELLSEEDISLIALVTMAEAEGECEKGKRLVIDTILNCMDAEYFPDTAYDVIYQPYQFSSMWNGRVDRYEVREDICQLVQEELETRTNYDVIFFTAGCYSDYGVPMFQVENHYFRVMNERRFL